MTAAARPVWMVLAAVVFATAAVPASAQRLSLSERIARLEQQMQNQDQGGVGVVNQVQTLQSQVQQLQGQIEQLQHQIEQMQKANKAQYVDLDSRIGRLESGNSTAPPANAPAAASSGPTELNDVDLGAPGDNSGAATPPPPPAPAEQGPGYGDSAASAADAQSVYDQAFQSLKDGDYAEASRRFRTFIQQYPDDALTPNAYYWLGESYYVTQNYPISQDTFQKLLQRFPASSKAPDALLKVGYCQYEMQQWDEARATLTSVAQKYPNTTVARLAETRLSALNLEAGH